MSKVLIFIDWYLPAFKAGGPIISINNIVNNLAGFHDFYVVTSVTDLGGELVVEKSDFNKWKKLDENHNVIYLNRPLFSIGKLINEIKPSIIYVNSVFSFKFSILPIVLAKKNKNIKRIIVAPRGMLGEGALKIKSFKKKNFILLAKIFNLYSQIFWHASTQKEALEVFKIFGNKSKVITAQNFASVSNQIGYKKKKKESGKLNILFASRISKKKNLLLLVNAICQSKFKKHITLKIIGHNENPEYFDKCLAFIKNNDISFDYLGPLPHSELSYHYQNCDIFCLPTLHENFGHVIMEALSFGMPILISKNTPWLNLENKQMGFDLELVSELFKEKIDLFYNLSDNEFSEFSKNALNYYKEMNNFEKVTADNVKLFTI